MRAAQQAFESGQIPQGHYVVLDPMGRIVRITDFLTSFSAETYQAAASGLRRVC